MDNASRFPNRELLLLLCIYQMLLMTIIDILIKNSAMLGLLIVALSEGKILSKYLTIMIMDH
jgi:hypothetical protein